MIKRILAINLIVLIMFTSCFIDYKKAYATALLPLLPEAGIATEEAMAWLMASFGLEPAPSVDFNDTTSVKQWGEMQKAKFIGFCINNGITAVKATAWITKVAEGTLDKGNEVWNSFKSWVTSLYPETVKYSNYGTSITGISPIGIDTVHFANSLGSSKVDLRFRDYNNDIKAIWCVVGNSLMELWLYSKYVFGAGNNVAYKLTNDIYVYPYQQCQGSYAELVCPEFPKTNKTIEEVTSYISPVAFYDNVGGISDIYDRDGDLVNYDVVGKAGNGTIADDVIPIDWQNIKDADGTITRTLEAVKTKAVPIDDVMADVGVIGIDLVRGKVIDSDKDTTNDKDVTAVTTPGEISEYRLNLTDLFPFCLPFDLVDFIKVLRATPESPKFTWKFAYPTINGMKTADLNVDLAPWNTVALIFRRMELLAFIIGLILITRSKMIRG